MNLIVLKHDYRTPLEKSLGIDPALCADRGMSPAEKARAKAIEFLRSKGIKVLELPNGKWSVTPEYPANASDAKKAEIDRNCEEWMRAQFAKRTR